MWYYRLRKYPIVFQPIITRITMCYLHWCYTWTALLSANQNWVVFSCILLLTLLDVTSKEPSPFQKKLWTKSWWHSKPVENHNASNKKKKQDQKCITEWTKLTDRMMHSLYFSCCFCRSHIDTDFPQELPSTWLWQMIQFKEYATFKFWIIGILCI